MYELYSKYRNKKGYKDSDVSKATGIPASTFTDWKNGRSKPNTEKLIKIADFLDTMAEYLDTPKSSLVTCPDCGLTYCSDYPKDVNEHQKQHVAWETAVEKFGELYGNYYIREKIKAKNRRIVDNGNNSLDDKYNAELEILKCLFSRSVESSGYDLKHVTFNEYVAMMLANPTYGPRLDAELFQTLKSEYGTLPGISSGTIYHIPTKTIDITKKDERDITKDLDSLMEKLSSKKYGPAAYDGEELSEDSVSLFKDELELALRRLKLINKEKYNPNKNKK